ncbi:37S ribosomal protein S24, mitochondrial [Dipsacomyces acuminosporus]|nr:37S ribosomal protein S24, mitochondrial [Dipsacomyces acuminosporus]
MQAIVALRGRLVRPAQLVRGVHASAIQLAGRKKSKANFKAHAVRNRKEHAEIYDEQDSMFDIDDMETWEYNDHHTYGHLLLESIRDVRKYARLIKFELPTLAEHAKPFRPPPASNVLRFERSFTLGEKDLSNDRKVVLRVTVSQLGLKGPELHKFLLLAGVRYNPETDELKMSEDRESTSLLNKKRLADTLNALISEAKKKDDMFADVPLDFAHHTHKPRASFPAKWLPKAKQQAK